MQYHFDWGWFIGGILLIAAAALFIRFHRWVADNFGAGLGDYERYKLYGLIGVCIGFLASLNIVPFILSFIARSLFGGGLR